MQQQEHNDSGNSAEPKLWYALRVTYHRELKVKADLEERGIECFVPMTYRDQMQNGERVKKLVPSIHNLIFMHIEAERMQAYKRDSGQPIRYIMDHETHRPITVPEAQMRSFIAVTGHFTEPIIYLTPHPGDFSRGDRVRIMGGPFKGVEGVFVRVKGDRRVVVSIEGVVAVATTFIHPSLIEKLPPPAVAHASKKG